MRGCAAALLPHKVLTCSQSQGQCSAFKLNLMASHLCLMAKVWYINRFSCCKQVFYSCHVARCSNSRGRGRGRVRSASLTFPVIDALQASCRRYSCIPSSINCSVQVFPTAAGLCGDAVVEVAAASGGGGAAAAVCAAQRFFS